MFARKQKAFAIPTRQDLNALWLRARKEIGSSVSTYIAQPSLGGLLVELSVKCYRSSLQPRWQLSLLRAPAGSRRTGIEYGESVDAICGEYIDTLICSDLSVVSRWLAKCLLALDQPKLSCGALKSDLTVQWFENSLDEIDDEREMVDISCAVLFQAFSAGSATGRLSIENTAFHGTVDWSNGRITRAYWSKLAGTEAIIQMVLLTKGRYSFDSRLGFVAAEALTRSSLAISSSIKSDLSISLDLVLLEAAYRQEQLNLLLSCSGLHSVAVKRKENLFSQARINRKLTQTCGHQHLVYCLELLRFLGQEELALSELQRRSELPDSLVVEAAAMLVRAGFVRLKCFDESLNTLRSSPKSALLNAFRESVSRFELGDGLRQGLKISLQSSVPMSFVLIKGLSGKINPALREKIGSMLKDNDQTYEIDDGCLLVALSSCAAFGAAEFVRRLRVKSNKAIYLKRIFANNCANFAFSSSVASAPEDGSELQIVLDKARRALTVSKRLNQSIEHFR